MGRVCAVTGCGRKIDDRGSSNVKFHLILGNSEPRRRKWLQASALSPNDPTKFLYVCSAHFAGGMGHTHESSDPDVQISSFAATCVKFFFLL